MTKLSTREQYKLAYQWARHISNPDYYRDGIEEYIVPITRFQLLEIAPHIIGLALHHALEYDRVERINERFAVPFWERRLFAGSARQTHYLGEMAYQYYGIEAVNVVACWDEYLKSRKDGAWVRHIV